jgi:hypothetical protein
VAARRTRDALPLLVADVLLRQYCSPCFGDSGQEALFDCHAHALEIFGGVPAGKIHDDNLKAESICHLRHMPPSSSERLSLMGEPDNQANCF